MGKLACILTRFGVSPALVVHRGLAQLTVILPMTFFFFSERAQAGERGKGEREREREREREGNKERDGGRDLKQVPHSMWSPTWASIPQP